MNPQFPKKCGKCSTLHDEASWVELPYVGAWDDGVEVLSLRNCCGTTLAIVLGPSPDKCSPQSAA